MCGPGVAFPSTQGWIWAFLSGNDATELHDRARALRSVLGEGFTLREEVATFQYRNGRDLTGFEDGTENPKDERAIAAAIVSGQGDALDGSSFAAIQRYVHDLDGFARLSTSAKENVIGRSLETNEELASAPASAHVKRTAQESFDPPAFVVRRAMPWGGSTEHGSYFLAYGESLDRFERLLARMAGHEDGIVDGLLGITRPVTGGYYWCPPVREGRVHLAALGL
jgi:putative iron-dependent peroxidase